MIRVLLISFLGLFACACQSYYGYDLTKRDFVKADTVVANTFFSKVGDEHIFRAEIKAFGREIKGLCVIKKINDSLHRVVLTSDFGNTLFDFSIYEDRYEHNFVMPDLDRKIIVNTLGKDFLYFLKNSYRTTQKASVKNKAVYESIHKGKRILLVVDKHTSKVEEVVWSSTVKPKVLFKYDINQTGHFSIQHKNFPLEIMFTPLETK